MGRRVDGRGSTPQRARQLWLVPAAGESQSQAVARVVLRAPVFRPVSRRVPPELSESLRPGANVKTTLGRGRRVVEGLCIGVDPRSWDQTLPPIVAAHAGVGWLSPALVELGLWVSEYYVASPWKAFALIVPATLRRPRQRMLVRYRALPVPDELDASTRRRAALEAIQRQPATARELREACGVGPALLRAMVRDGLIERVLEPVPAAASPPPVAAGEMRCDEDDYALTDGQSAAVERILAALDAPPDMRVFLLFGVPGSGKTEVYVRAIRAAVARGRQAIVLVPEIALATQVGQRLARRFERVVTLHSRLTPAARRAALESIAAGSVDVVIGTRAAVFAPCPRLGLIVVDEEQESSFKHLAAPYFHTRDVAIKRAQIERVPVVLGSATPALETWYNALHRPHYELLRLPERVPGARLPTARAVAQPTAGREQVEQTLSPALAKHIEGTLASGGQVVLLHNRRGFAAVLRCDRCGAEVRCPRCRTRAVYHRVERLAKCHRCGLRVEAGPHCEDATCGGSLRPVGLAIQRLEEELKERFPAARLRRVDSDTMLERGDYADALGAFESGQVDILVGTQMVAKGLDFPNVRLVGVVDADAALSLPDFRAPERVLQLIVQVVGRAGRREGDSLAIVQTAGSPPAVIRRALALDYEGFATEELAVRERRGYPPFSRLARVVCLDARAGRARAAAEALVQRLRVRAEALDAGIRIENAVPCLVARQHNRQRWEVLIRSPRAATLQRLLAEAADAGELRRGAERIVVDVDPLDFL